MRRQRASQTQRFLLRRPPNDRSSSSSSGSPSWAGVSATLQLALEIVRLSGQVTKVGWGPQPYEASLDPLVQKGVTLQGSFSHNWPMWEKVIAMLASGQINLDPILSRVSPLADWRGAFDAMGSGKIVKAVLQP